MKKIITIALILISLNVFSQNTASDSKTIIVNQSKTELITLQELIEKIKTENESIKNSKDINVMVNDLLIENLHDYMIDPKSVSKLEILVLDPKGVNRKGTKPAIIITTKKVK